MRLLLNGSTGDERLNNYSPIIAGSNRPCTLLNINLSMNLDHLQKGVIGAEQGPSQLAEEGGLLSGARKGLNLMIINHSVSKNACSI